MFTIKKDLKIFDKIKNNSWQGHLEYVINKVWSSLIAQSVEQVAVNHWVGGSSPSQGAIFL